MKLRHKLLPITTLALASISTLTFAATSCGPKPDTKPEYKETEDLSPGKEFTPTIPATTQYFNHGGANDNKIATDAYFKNENAPIIVKDDVCGYLKPYIDTLADLGSARQWLQENLPIISAIVEKILSDYGLDGLGNLESTTVGITKPTITSTNLNDNAVSPYKMTSTITIGAKAELMDDVTDQLVKWGDVEVKCIIQLINVPYSIYYSNSGKWMCGNGNGELSSVGGWTISLNITGKTIPLSGEEQPITPIEKTWDSIPTEPTEKQEFEKVRSMLQWNSTYLSKSNEE